MTTWSEWSDVGPLFSRLRPRLDAKKLPALHHKVDPFVKQVDVRQGQHTLDVAAHTAYEARAIAREPFQADAGSEEESDFSR
jgi:hypothetical protein